jgi:hypothetical protein
VARGGGSGGRSTAGVVLMSVVGLVGLGGLSSSSSALFSRKSASSGGMVLASHPVNIAGRIVWAEDSHASSLPNPEPTRVEMLLDDILPSGPTPDYELPAMEASSRKHDAHNPDDDRPRRNPHGYPTGPPITWQRMIGRISAWTCTVLYLTSRMPQIWMNVSE